ncbi:serine/threonine-protein kinase [Paraliomyxa miuraensis]|uniref:serine/threonine-protein kinase n=1 Tax=Paraliomyxa miuraensis TaxID=376150 RepID=UPI0022574600|nr:serine/threonine-protein kinase [Paraliomyxa miuraensis]MCX4241441.1 serine/threonine-protein kinase [Paraliomyxa miuraensis]
MDSRETTGTRSTADAETIVEAPDGRRILPQEVDESGLTPGTHLGRYVVLEMIGSGGMGMVLAAYDPELNRKVALKLMRPTKRDRRRERKGKGGRLLQEAQALAKLAHPNVITVYDVGTWEDRVFVAMELVEGSTLKGWLRARKRRWDEVLAVFVPAGRGLAAAHAAGLVHRDFKPDNVLIGDDGRVRVMDFGLAAPVPGTDTDSVGSVESLDLLEAALAPPAAGGRSETSRPDMVASLMSQTGSVMGTPAYMAPEQHVRKATDARSDLYSFCVALYHGLYGALPFDGEDTSTLTSQKLADQLAEPPSGASVPGWVRKAVLKGLASDRALRWASMDELLAELENDPRVARRKWLGIAGGVLLAGGSLGTVVYLRSQRPEVCQGAEQELAAVWNEERKSAASEGLRAAAVPDTDGAWLAQGAERIVTLVDGYGAAWVEMSTDACEATYVRGEQSARLLAQRHDCLDRRRAELDVLAQILADATPEVVPHAFEAASSLSPLSRCADSESLAAAVDPPETDQARVAVNELRHELARVQMLDAAGRHEEADTLAQQLLSQAQAQGYAPVEAEARFHLGLVKHSRADAKAAEEHLSESHWQASSVKHDTVAAAAASALVDVVGIELQRRDEGLGWARHAEAAFKRIGLGGVDEAALRHRVGSIHAANGNLDEASEAFEQAQALYDKQPHRALALARVLHDLAAIRRDQGRYDEAVALLEQARTLVATAAGEHHPELARALSGLGRVADAQGRAESARVRYREALALLESTVGPRHPWVAEIYEDLARSHARAEERSEATRMQEQAYDLLKQALGDHPQVAQALFDLGTLRAESGGREQARKDWDQALALWESTRGKDHPALAYPLTRLAALDLEDGHPKQAVERLERALKVRGRKGLAPMLLAATQFDLAKALHESGEDRTRAQELARKARKTYEDAGSQGVASMAAVDRWLAEVGPEQAPPSEQ